MDTVTLKVDRTKADAFYRDYLKHQHYDAPIDDEIRRAYYLIAKGRMIIQALESVRLAGLNDEGWPKLALARADQKAQRCVLRTDGSMTLSPHSWRRRGNDTRLSFDWPAGAFPPRRPNQTWDAEALLPLIPLPQRPKRGLQNYHILWEAEWTRVVPKDPLLLRRLGKGDLWLVVAQWDLTPVERAALATRVNTA